VYFGNPVEGFPRLPAKAKSSERIEASSFMVSEGYKFGLPPIVAGVVFLVLHWFPIGVVLVFLGLFVFYFFRDPERVIPSDSGTVVSPADGKVVVIVDEPHDGKPGQRISIFLSIWNVHIQRAPVAGTVGSVVYRPGKFLGAYRAAASEVNEQNVITILTPRGSMVFKQIAGAIARRVICWKREGETVALGERVGMIRFGSRVDVWLPPEAKIAVQKGQMVKGGESILAKWNSTT
jgi:phosphatidylserine decarboxylase